MKIATQTIPKGYKQTEIGVIPEDWDVKRLGDIVQFNNGKAHERFIDDKGNYIVVNSKFISTAGEVFKNSFENLSPLSAGNIAMVMSDIPNGKALAKCFFVEKDGRYTLNQRICAFKSNGADSLYLFYKLNRNKYFLDFDSGVGQTNLKKSEVLDCLVALPVNKEEQSSIAIALSDTDILIIKLEKLTEKKKNIKQGVMQELLTGKRRLPGFNGEWITKPLPEIAWFQEGPGVRTSQFTERGVKLLNGTNIFRGKVLLENTNRFISESEAFGPYSHFMVDDGDIVIASSGITIDKFEEKIAFISKEHLPLCMNTSTIRFKVKDHLKPSFLYYFLMSKKFKDQIGAQATGSAQLNFGPSHLEKVEIYMPKDEKEQTAIANVLSDMDTDIEKLESQLLKYQNIKQGMMQTLLTGKIRLK
ncbi:MAG: restriction endonuclease subunit S [Dysgonamonadaceae bacterium]|nr:restriction endonuclease subunit S [Proteiniphilum sp.]MDD4399746.1 restriction endonuclease subunit S [Dysgonamonadaceae bacterium]